MNLFWTVGVARKDTKCMFNLINIKTITKIDSDFSQHAVLFLFITLR